MVRQSLPVLRTGDYEPVYASERILAYLRVDHEEKVLVLINAGDQAQTVSIPLNGAFEEQTILQDQIGPKSFTVEEDTLANVNIPAQTGYILA